MAKQSTTEKQGTESGKTFDSMTELDWAVRGAQAHTESAYERLLAQVEYLEAAMTRLARKLRNEGTETHVNELGEAQTASEVNRLCAVFMAAKWTQEMLTKLQAEQHEKEAGK